MRDKKSDFDISVAEISPIQKGPLPNHKLPLRFKMAVPLITAAETKRWNPFLGYQNSGPLSFALLLHNRMHCKSTRFEPAIDSSIDSALEHTHLDSPVRKSAARIAENHDVDLSTSRFRCLSFASAGGKKMTKHSSYKRRVV